MPADMQTIHCFKVKSCIFCCMAKDLQKPRLKRRFHTRWLGRKLMWKDILGYLPCKYACEAARVFVYGERVQAAPTDIRYLGATRVDSYILRSGPRRRSKSGISRVDLLSTVSYSVSSSNPPDRRPATPLWSESLRPWELPGPLWSLVLFVVVSAIDWGMSGQTGRGGVAVAVLGSSWLIFTTWGGGRLPLQ